MSESDNSSKRGGIFGKDIPEKWLIFAGDCDLVNEYLHDKSGPSVFLLFQYINSLLRSFGFVIFANNPISGLIIFISILATDYMAALAGVLCSTVSFLFALFLKQDSLGNLNGFFGYNAVLLGTFSAGLLPQLYATISVDEPKFWLFLITAAVISVYVTSALANLFRYLGQHPIPCFLLPFNFLQYILIFCLLNNSMPPTIISEHLLQAPATKGDNSSLSIASAEVYLPAAEGSIPSVSEVLNFDAENRSGGNAAVEGFLEGNRSAQVLPENVTHWHWGEVFAGTILSVSQIYGVPSIPGSVFMFLALMVYSPTTTLFCYVGSLLGTLLGTTFASAAQEVYSGHWGYNGLLCGGALAGFGFVLTSRSTVLTLSAVVFATVLQHYLSPLFSQMGVPMFTAPFNVTSVLFLCVTSDSKKALPRPANFSFPEKHRHEFREALKGGEEKEGYLRRSRVSGTFTPKYDV